MEPAEYDSVAHLQNTHWWYRGMAAICVALLTAHLRARRGGPPTPARILDAGCGPGGMLTRLARFGYVAGVDLHPLALRHARGRGPLAQASVEALPFSDGSFDVITSLDVLYHRQVADDGRALAEFRRLLRPGGLLLLRVPAFEALRGAHDAFVHGSRRYAPDELRAKLARAGLSVELMTFANMILSPVVYFHRRLAPAWRRPSGLAAASDVWQPGAFVNWLLELMLAVERSLILRFPLPFGTSLLVVAGRPAAQV